MAKLWKKGRGKLGVLQPLLGRWEARADTPMGPVRCTREFEPTLRENYVRLNARWEFPQTLKGKGKASASEPGRPMVYEEVAMIGVRADGTVGFWSFTNDGKHSEGHLTDVTDLHPEAVGFEAQMPAGTARMAYWPDGEGGFIWVVESKNAKGWRRFTEHHTPARGPRSGVPKTGPQPPKDL
jgi:hypothetical protein